MTATTKKYAVHIHRPSGVYVGQRRRRRERTWESVTEDCPNEQTALKQLADKLRGCDFGRVIFCAEYYEPNVTLEIKR